MMSSMESRNDLREQLISKAWVDESFRKELLTDPKTAIEKELGVRVPENLKIKVVEETLDTVYLVLPVKPSELQSTGEAITADTDSEVGMW